MQLGKEMLGRRHVLPSVVPLMHEIQVEGTFPDGYAFPYVFVRNAIIEHRFFIKCLSCYRSRSYLYAVRKSTERTVWIVPAYPFTRSLSGGRRVGLCSYGSTRCGDRAEAEDYNQQRQISRPIASNEPWR